VINPKVRPHLTLTLTLLDEADKAVVRTQCAKLLLIQTFDPGEVIIRKGDKPTGFFINLEGEVILNKDAALDETLGLFSTGGGSEIKKAFTLAKKIRAQRQTTPHNFFKNETRKLVEFKNNEMHKINPLMYDMVGIDDTLYHYVNGLLQKKIGQPDDENSCCDKESVDKSRLNRSFAKIDKCAHEKGDSDYRDVDFNSPLKPPRANNIIGDVKRDDGDLSEVGEMDSLYGARSNYSIVKTLNRSVSKIEARVRPPLGPARYKSMGSTGLKFGSANIRSIDDTPESSGLALVPQEVTSFESEETGMQRENYGIMRNDSISLSKIKDPKGYLNVVAPRTGVNLKVSVASRSQYRDSNMSDITKEDTPHPKGNTPNTAT
jgi:hypothetical protein